MIYLDNAATSPVRREVLEAMWPFLTGEFGNPSSTHDPGRRAADALAAAHSAIAAALGCRASEIVVTSGGTEADNLAVKGIALGNPRGRHLITSAIEHEAVLESADQLRRLHGFEVTILPVDSEGLVAVTDLSDALRDDTTLVSIQHANNEIGTVQPIRELADAAHAAGVPFHTDAVQSAGWLPIGLSELGVDAISISGHKLGAPKGVGALAVRAGLPLEPVLAGGGQERGRRSGTENVAGAAGLGVALTLAAVNLSPTARAAAERVALARDALIAEIERTVPDALLTGSRRDRLPGTVSFCFPGTSGEAVLLELERQGVIGSSGSACAAGRDDPSYVLLALGLSPEVAQTSVRLTLDASITVDEAMRVAGLVADSVRAVGAIVR